MIIYSMDTVWIYPLFVHLINSGYNALECFSNEPLDHAHHLEYLSLLMKLHEFIAVFLITNDIDLG